MSEAKPLSELVGEVNTIGEALLNLIAGCPDKPDVPLQYNSIKAEESIGIFTGKGTFKPDVLGGFSAKINFQVAYKSFPNANGQSIKAQETVNKIMKYLTKANLPQLSGGRTILKVTVSDAVPFKEAVEKDNAITYVSDGVMEYEKE